jgi:Protein of unknown function (DUF1566)
MMKTRSRNFSNQLPVSAGFSRQKRLDMHANKGVWLFYLRAFANQMRRHIFSLMLVAALCSTTGIDVVTAAPFTISADGQEITDHETGLVWQRCVEGARWDGSHCTGQARDFTFDSALLHAAFESAMRGTFWRLPKLGELLSIADPLRATPAIDATNFPDTPAEIFWTSSVFAGNRADQLSEAMFVDFSRGGYLHHDRATRHHVRLVRDLQ